MSELNPNAKYITCRDHPSTGVRVAVTLDDVIITCDMCKKLLVTLKDGEDLMQLKREVSGAPCDCCQQEQQQGSHLCKGLDCPICGGRSHD